jgi:hypothetical protein
MKFIIPLLVVAVVVVGCNRGNDSQSKLRQRVSHNATGESVVWLDLETQQRLALKTGIPVSAPAESHESLIIPAEAVLRLENKVWVYVQTGNDEFTRRQITLGKPTETGWFASGDVSLTNQIVIVGAGTVLSAELTPDYRH